MSRLAGYVDGQPNFSGNENEFMAVYTLSHDF